MAVRLMAADPCCSEAGVIVSPRARLPLDRGNGLNQSERAKIGGRFGATWDLRLRRVAWGNSGL